MYFDKRVPANLTRLSYHENTSQNINETCLRRTMVAKIGTRVEWEYKSSISLTYECSGDFKMQALSPFWCMYSLRFSRTLCLENRDNAARDVILIPHGNSIIIWWNVSARAKPSTVRWLSRLPSKYYLKASVDENNYIIHTHQA